MQTADANAPNFQSAEQDLVPVKLPVQGTNLEMIVLAVLVSASSIALPMFGYARQLAGLAILALFVLRWNDVRPYAQHFWFLFLFPVWVALSVIWSPVPSKTLNFALSHIVEIVALVYFASRLSPHQLIKSIFWGGQIMFFMALPHFATIDPYHIPPGFSIKNWLANLMFVAMVSSLYVVFSGKNALWERLLAAFCIPLSFMIVVKAESATALVLSLFSIFFMVMVGLFWRMVASVKMLPTLVMVSIVAAALLGMVAAGLMLDDDPMAMFLGALGKDTSLTGRTDLWDHANTLIAERPFLGLGAEGFWLPWRGDAQILLEIFLKGQFTRFSFHNSYYEITVHLGVIGLLFMLIAEVYILSRIVISWFKNQDVTAAFFLMFGILVLIRSFTESELYNPLNINKMILFLGGMSFLAHRTGWAPREWVESQLALQNRGK